MNTCLSCLSETAEPESLCERCFAVWGLLVSKRETRKSFLGIWGQLDLFPDGEVESTNCSPVEQFSTFAQS
jgi:hypothetical protein